MPVQLEADLAIVREFVQLFLESRRDLDRIEEQKLAAWELASCHVSSDVQHHHPNHVKVSSHMPEAWRDFCQRTGCSSTHADGSCRGANRTTLKHFQCFTTQTIVLYYD
eukprot:3684414-Rhodomonas_salina.1